MFVLDSHCDTPSQILRLRDMSIDNDHAHVDFPKLVRGNVDGAFFALYIPSSMDADAESAFGYARKLLEGVRESVMANPKSASFATSRQEAYSNKEKGLFSVFLGLENGSPIGEDLERIGWFHEVGVRYMTLCHSGNNLICDSCSPSEQRWGGLSPFGKDVIAEMNRLGMLVDVSHVSDASFYDVLEHSVRPVVATHSCCRALSAHPRNMTDEMIKKLAEAGGVIQVNFYPVFLDVRFREKLLSSGIIDRGERVENEFIAEPWNLMRRAAWNQVQDELQRLQRPSYKLIADHIDHIVDLVGTDHVGIGSDYDGIEVTPEGMEDISMMPKLFEELESRGYLKSDLQKIAGENFFRILG